MQPQIASVLALANGTSLITESVWNNRFKYVDELKRLGARIQVDGKTLDSDAYTADSGSTVVTLEPTYLETLTEGKHHLTVLYTDGQCGTSFIVQAAEDDPTEDANDAPTEDTEEKSSNKSDKAVKSTSKKTGTPKTGDSADPTLWAAMLMVSGVALGVLCWSKRRER